MAGTLVPKAVWTGLKRLGPALQRAGQLAMLLAMGIFLAVNLTRNEPQQRPTQGAFSAYVRDTTVTETDSQGRLSLELWAAAGWMHPDHSTLLRGVHIRYHDPRQPKPWLLRAKQALISPDHTRVDLHGDVEAEIMPQGRSVPMLLDTQALTAWPEEKRLATEVGVLLHDETGTWLRAQSLYYEPNGLIRLSGRVRGHLEVLRR